MERYGASVFLFVFALEVSLFFTLSEIVKNVSLLADKNYDNLFSKISLFDGSSCTG